MRPSVSVLIPTYNRASFLPGTLDSVFRQTLPPHEVVLVDDGSTDETVRVVESLMSRNSDWASRLCFIRQANTGKSGALNAALQVAGGQWIAFNDSDDRWLPDKLEKQFAALSRFPDCLVSFTETSLHEFRVRHPELAAGEDGRVGQVDDPSYLYPASWPGTYMQTLVVRSDVMKACGELDPEYRLSHDVDLLFRLGLLTPFCFVNEPLVEISREPQRTVGLMTAHPAGSLRAMLEAESMLQKWLRMLDDRQLPLRRMLTHELASMRSALANRYLISGDVPAARQALRHGMRDTPDARLLCKCVLAYTVPALLRKFAVAHAPVEFFAGGDTTSDPRSRNAPNAL
jgi:glycosyltransferase involved in cell wall biosynthesis